MDAEWQAALPRLRDAIGERNFSVWIEPIRCVRETRGLRLEVPNRFYQEWVTRNYLQSICDALGPPESAPEVRIVVTEPAEETPSPTPGTTVKPVKRESTAASLRKRTLQVGRLVPHYVFDNFVVGPSNQVASQAACQVVETLGKRLNPLFLWGGVGLGKTHLVNAIGHSVLHGERRGRVGCLSAEAFMNLLIGALRQDQMNAFRDRFRELDVLILDDVQFLAGKERTQEEFFHTFEALYTAGRQIVLTSDKPPHAINELEHRLRSRFEGGMIADVRPPTFEMRVEIACRKAQLNGTPISHEIASAIARCCGPSVRELEGALTRVLAIRSLEKRDLTDVSVERILSGAVPARKLVSVESVIECVAAHSGLRAEDLRSHRRARALSQARQIAMFLCRLVAHASLASIAEQFGGRDHTSVLYSVRVVEERKRKDVSLQRTLDELLSLLDAPPVH